MIPKYLFTIKLTELSSPTQPGWTNLLSELLCCAKMCQIMNHDF